MFNRNVTMIRESANEFSVRLADPELTQLCAKYGGLVNVKISRPVEPGTEEQNRAMHSLLAAYYTTGMHSAPEGCTLDGFKIYMKIAYGPCYETEYKGQPVRVLKSWADYTKRERMEFIDGLISEIHQSGAFAESEKIREIIGGMNGD